MRLELERIRSAAAGEVVASRTAVQHIVAASSSQEVIAIPTDEDVVTFKSEDEVIAWRSEERVIGGRAIDGHPENAAAIGAKAWMEVCERQLRSIYPLQHQHGLIV